MSVVGVFKKSTFRIVVGQGESGFCFFVEIDPTGFAVVFIKNGEPPDSAKPEAAFEGELRFGFGGLWCFGTFFVPYFRTAFGRRGFVSGREKRGVFNQISSGLKGEGNSEHAKACQDQVFSFRMLHDICNIFS